jgi:hypothetical protein
VSERGASDDRGTCGCCGGVHDRVPALITNRPGLSEIGYRVGTYSQFKQSLLAGLTDASRPALGRLLSRDDDDFAIGLIDAWAMVGDVLTFYAERAAQEHYLATATELRSVAALVHLIGYRPHPGVAASTALAFTLEANPLAPATAPPGAPERVPIAKGTRVQSIPGPDERPQTFETIEDIEALVAWNRLTPRLTRLRYPHDGETTAYLAGAALNLSPGDSLLFIAEQPASGARPWAMGRVMEVTSQAEANRTLVSWEPPLVNLAAAPTPGAAGTPVQVFVLRQRASLFGYNAPDPRLLTKDVTDNLKALLSCKPTTGNAWLACNASGASTTILDWFFPEISNGTVALDAIYQGLRPDGWAVFTKPNPNAGAANQPPDIRLLARITSVSERSRSGFAIGARVTEVVVEPADLKQFSGSSTRDTAILLGSEELELAERPINAPVAGMEIELPAIQAVDPPAAPRKVVVRGRLAPGVEVTAVGAGLSFNPDASTVAASALAEGETLTLLGYRQEPGSTGKSFWRLRTTSGVAGEVERQAGTLTFLPAATDDPVVAEVALVAPMATGTPGKVQTLALSGPLRNVYDRPTVEIFGNVADATHGESIRNEVLGSGDAARPYQQFPLDKEPLTYTSAPTPSGGKSTLEVWVNDVRWDEAATFFGASPRDRIYVTGVTEMGETAVRFGDGANGARLPTGYENVRANYRTGIGAAGNLGPDRLTLLMTRPLGLKGVNNPVPAEGGQEPQTPDDARGGAPLTVLTLDRIVSLQDYEDYARAFAGVAKAAAVTTWDGERQGVLITVAGIDGAMLEAGDKTYDNFVAAIAAAGNPRLDVRVKPHRPQPFHVAASLLVESRHDPEIVLARARAQLLARFSFDARAFGQLVSLSEVMSALQSVPGVVAVDVDKLYRDDSDAPLNPYLVADAPAPGASPDEEGAELLTLDPASLEDVEVQP